MVAPEGAHTADSFLLQQARALWTSGQLDAAVERFERAVAEDPDNIRALIECARAQGKRYEVSRAESLLQRATALAGDDPQVAPLIAQSYRLIHRPQQALRGLERLRDAGVLPLPLLAELAILYEQTNQIDAAYEAIGQCVQLAPQQPEPRLVLARIHRARGELPAAEALLNSLLEQSAQPLLHVRAWSELCQLRDQVGDYDGAVGAIEQAKQILRTSGQAESMLQRAAALNDAFRGIYGELDADLLDQWRGTPLPHDARCSGIAHLLGFPRSGTTLLEQLLEAHPQLVGSPERPIFSREIFPAMYRIRGDEPLQLSSLKAIPPQHLTAQRQRYLDCMEAVLGEPLAGRVHLDKNPNHTSLIVALFRLFPESRFLFALRDPRDIMVSTYLRFFPLTEFSATFLSWAGLCTQYRHEMDVWLTVRGLIEPQAEEIRYEDLVRDPAGQARRALQRLKLDWHHAVADYRQHIQQKIVNSPSQAAVREPINTRAIGRWKNYRRYLEPYLASLEPYCREFGYE